MNQVTIASTLSGRLALKHPKHGIFCRDDGFILIHISGWFVKYKSYEIPHKWSNGTITKQGYRLCSINGNTYRLHRIICEAFHENTENKPTVDHIDRNRSNNAADNLRWATAKEQTENSIRIINRLRYSARQCENRAQYDKEYRLDHILEKKAYDKQYKSLNKERIKEKGREYAKRNREKLNERARKYRASHPEYVRRCEEQKKAKRKLLNSQKDSSQ